TLAIMPLNGTEKDLINIPFDRTKGGLQWTADEKYLYFTAQSNGGVTLNRVDMQTRKVESLTDFNSGVGSYATANDKVVFVKTEVANPFDLYVTDGAGKNPKRISSFN